MCVFMGTNMGIDTKIEIVRWIMIQSEHYNNLASFLPELAIPTGIPLIKNCSSSLSLRINLITLK